MSWKEWVGLLLYVFSFGSFMICGIIYLVNTYSGTLKTLEDAVVISTSVILSSCVDTCRYSDSTHHSDPYICYKPNIIFQISSSSELCSYVNPTSSTNETLTLVYAKQHFPLQANHVIYKTGGHLNGMVTCDDANNHYQQKQKMERQVTKVCKQLSIFGLTMFLILMMLFYCFEIRQCHKSGLPRFQNPFLINNEVV